MNTKVSFVVAVYNVAPYVGEKGSVRKPLL